MNKTFYLFRHAIAVLGNQGYGNKIISAQILPQGIPPIKRMGEYLRNIQTDLNVCSEFIRCQQTASIIAKITGKEFSLDKRLNEFYDGSNESASEFMLRVKNFYEEMQRSSNQAILICTHAAVINALKFIALGEKPTEPQIHVNAYCILTALKGKSIEEINFN